MFGKPEWFQQTTCCRAVTPVVGKGWLYLAGLGAFIILPTTALALTGRVFPEAVIWLAASSVAFLWEVRDIRRQLQAARDRNLFYIRDEEQESPELATRHFDLKLRG